MSGAQGPVAAGEDFISGARRCTLRVRSRGGPAVASPAIRSEGEGGAAFVLLRTLVQEKRRVTLLLAARLWASSGGTYALGDPVVIKATDKRCAGQGAREDPYHEIAAMRLLGAAGGHRNVLPLLDALEDDDYIYTVLPYVPGGDLYYRLRASPGPLAMDEARRIFVGVCRGLSYMAGLGLAHRDISLENILIDDSGSAQLIDFGVCKFVPPSVGPSHLVPSQPAAGKASYLSPEVARQEAFDPFAADVWSLGVLLHILLTQTPLYTSPDDPAFDVMELGQVELLLDHYATLGVSLPCPTARDLVAWMCAADPLQRPTVEQVLAHPWVAGGTPEVEGLEEVPVRWPDTAMDVGPPLELPGAAGALQVDVGEELLLWQGVGGLMCVHDTVEVMVLEGLPRM